MEKVSRHIYFRAVKNIQDLDELVKLLLNAVKGTGKYLTEKIMIL